jgi:hypothetical protein
MSIIQVKITISNDHSSKTDSYEVDELLLSLDDSKLKALIAKSKNKFDHTLDLEEFKPKIVVKTKMEV